MWEKIIKSTCVFSCVYNLCFCNVWRGFRAIAVGFLFLCIPLPIKRTSVMYRNFKIFNGAKFRNDIYNENWEFMD